MPITCDHCGKTYIWRDEYASRKIRCKCGNLITMPDADPDAPSSAATDLRPERGSATGAGAAAPAATSVPISPSVPATPVAPAAPDAAAGQNQQLKLILLALVVLVIVLIIGGIVLIVWLRK